MVCMLFKCILQQTFDLKRTFCQQVCERETNFKETFSRHKRLGRHHCNIVPCTYIYNVRTTQYKGGHCVMENQITKVFYVRTKNPKSTGNQGREQGTIPRKYSFAFVKFLFPPSSSLCVETGEAEQKRQLSLPRSGKTERPM